MAPLVAVLFAAATACGSAEGDDWADEAVRWQDALVHSQSELGGEAVWSFVGPGVEWDPRSLDPWAPLTRGAPAERAIATQLGPENFSFGRERLVGIDGLVVTGTLDTGGVEPLHVVLRFAPIDHCGAQRVVSAMAVDDWRTTRADATWSQHDEAEAIARTWTQRWSGHGSARDLYEPDATLRDSISGVRAVGLDEILAVSSRQPGRWQITSAGVDDVTAVYPLVAGSEPDAPLVGVAFIVSGEDGAGCAERMAVWLTLRDGAIRTEERYRSIDGARRCLESEALPDGWWTGRPVPTPSNVEVGPLDAQIEADDGAVTVCGGSPMLSGILAWGIERFDAAGLDAPTIARVTFVDGGPSCVGRPASCAPSRSGAELTFCLREPTDCRHDSCESFVRGTQLIVLHELAHAWMNTELTPERRRAYLDHVGLDAWNDPAATWTDRAVERAADNIAWGLVGCDLSMPRLGLLSTDHLVAGFRLLTGVDPLV